MHKFGHQGERSSLEKKKLTIISTIKNYKNYRVYFFFFLSFILMNNFQSSLILSDITNFVDCT